MFSFGNNIETEEQLIVDIIFNAYLKEHNVSYSMRLLRRVAFVAHSGVLNPRQHGNIHMHVSTSEDWSVSEILKAS